MARVARPAQLKAMLRDGQELALVDVREQGVYFHGHLLFAACIPLSHLEMRVADLIPRKGTRIVVCDGGDEDLARRAADRLTSFGYLDVAVLEGGVRGWREAGYEVFSGVNVVSKAFGEYVEHRYDTPRLSAEELNARIARGENMIILDSRPMEEYTNLSIPGGIDCPGAELVYRVFDAAPAPDTLVVVNCAGRTRSIIGAQSLLNAGIPNRVMALKNGTMGWQLAGFEVARGQTRHAADPSDAGSARARVAAGHVAVRFNVKTIDMARLAQWQAESDSRSLYVLDVRTAAEFAAGHLPGSRHAPGGQLVQATDEYVATRHARVVLVDDNGVRAIMTASWLNQMGWNEVRVLYGGLTGELETGPHVATRFDFAAAPTMTAKSLQKSLAQSDKWTVFDFATSLQFRRQHIPGARWAVRSRLAEALAVLPDAHRVVVTSPGDILAHYAARDLMRAQPTRDVKVLEGGTRAWMAAGYASASNADGFTTKANDVWYKPYEQSEGVRKAMEEYLTWEVNLMPQIERDGDARFR
ncbi:MAG: rhodanese-like domain-containing protein [Burkholderiales bacterium]